jgi:hypothetical protein
MIDLPIVGLPVDNLWADLDFGSLTYMYDMLLPNVSAPPRDHFKSRKLDTVHVRETETETVLGPHEIFTTVNFYL